MHSLRQHLAEARSSLRQAKDAIETAKIVATMEVSGRNEAERKANAAIALLNDRAYTEALAHVRDCEAAVERAEAEIAEQEYQLRVREVAVREKLAEALMGRRTDDAAIDTLSSVEAAQRRGYAPADSAPSNPKDGGHKWLVHHNCENQYCNICEGGLSLCTVCGAAECELPSECPGVRMTPEQRAAVCAGTLNYKAGQWTASYDYTQDAEAAEATYQYQSRQPPLQHDWYKQNIY